MSPIPDKVRNPFEAGQRVIVTGWKQSAVDSATGMNGYYGHVVETYTGGSGRPMADVSLIGRVGAPARAHDLNLTGDNAWIFYADELEHAD